MAKDRAYSQTHGGLGCGGTSPAGKSSGAGAKPETTLSMVSHSQERQYLSCGAGVALVWHWCGTGDRHVSLLSATVRNNRGNEPTGSKVGAG